MTLMISLVMMMLLKIDRTNKMALLTRAYAKGKINNYEGALKDINSLIEMDSNFNKEAIYFRAWFHINLKNYSEAMNDYSRLIEIGMQVSQ